jgi:hypothetical protein
MFTSEETRTHLARLEREQSERAVDVAEEDELYHESPIAVSERVRQFTTIKEFLHLSLAHRRQAAHVDAGANHNALSQAINPPTTNAFMVGRLAPIRSRRTDRNNCVALRFGTEARLCAPAQQRCTHPVAQLLWRLRWRRRGRLRLHHGGRRGLRCFLCGLTRRELRQLFGRQVLRLGVDRFRRRAVKGDALVIAKYGLAVDRRHFPAAKHAERVGRNCPALC